VSQTTTMPPLAAAMSPADMHAACAALREMIGPPAQVYADVSAGPHADGHATVAVYPDGICHGTTAKRFRGMDWGALFEQARQWAVSYCVIAHDRALRRMALAIIDLTDQHGSCTADALRRAGHAVTPEMVEAACQRASEMSGNAPFRVEGV
jgi:hypothetical protein